MPVADGVPVMAPVLVFRIKPAGNAPADTDQVSGVVPPVEAIDCEYAVLSVPPGNAVVVIVNVAAVTIESALLAEAPAASTN